MNQILIIDDNKGIAIALEVLFSIYGIQTLHADTPEAGLDCLEKESIDLVIQDMNFTEDTTSGDEGRSLFKQINDLYPDLPVILLTAWGHLEMAVELVKQGAADYLTKPWDDTKLIATVNNLIELAQLRQQTNALIQKSNSLTCSISEKYDLCGTIFKSQAMTQTISIATQVASADIPVLITGPNGSGKEKIAEIIQANSLVADKPFIKVNVGALPLDLLEAELFGAEAGAFTGANKKRIGRFESADGGTLFLDEMGNLPLSGQVKLLRVLQTGEFERLGSSVTQKVNVRVISATNADLKTRIQSGSFREDLYYRLNVIEVKVAPLSERTDDIIPLTLHMMPKHLKLSAEAENTLTQYHWPGNVRELENVIKRASLLAQNSSIDAADLGIELPILKTQKKTTNEPGENQIIQALEDNRFNISQAAQQLGLSRQSLYRRMDKFNIPKTIDQSS
jgi:DNA-binding NtrC family response regulator